MKLIMITLFLVFLGACSSSKILNSWKSDAVTPGRYKKIMVVGLNGEDNTAMRAKMEQHLVGDLKDLGYHAVSSLQEYGPKAFAKKEEEAVVNELRTSGVDAVITIVLLDKEKERYYVPGELNFSPYFIYQRSFWGYYRTMYGRIYSPGYYTTTTRYFWESNLFDLTNTNKEWLYSVQTESFDPASIESLAHEYGKLIIKDIVKKQVLFKQEVVAGPRDR